MGVVVVVVGVAVGFLAVAVVVVAVIVVIVSALLCVEGVGVKGEDRSCVVEVAVVDGDPGVVSVYLGILGVFVWLRRGVVVVGFAVLHQGGRGVMLTFIWPLLSVLLQLLSLALFLLLLLL